VNAAAGPSHESRSPRGRARRGQPDLPPGYEFVEPLGGGQLRLGINFVSFQRNLSSVTNLLRLPSWLGDTNFGGVSDTERGAVRLTSMTARGFYAVPPATPGELFPGAGIF
jgi:hypothetical protein